MTFVQGTEPYWRKPRQSSPDSPVAARPDTRKLHCIWTVCRPGPIFASARTRDATPSYGWTPPSSPAQTGVSSPTPPGIGDPPVPYASCEARQPRSTERILPRDADVLLACVQVLRPDASDRKSVV